jgi:hypothetical protein
MEIQDTKNMELKRQNQHGFKKKIITSTLSSTLLSLIARAFDKDKYGLVSSLDLI